ncbi:MAG TPA: HAMP domain-containing methyl-accepting chemotaxis protein [Terriglobales bacterium]|jgi:methyl-accepting chemotaxis protein|nr:HAMP domain-containing methyl-accepting chemotaxis protein [Terriglobales bacterium]
MTIGKRLYMNFGAVLATVVVLFVINLLAVYREHSAKAAASQALELADATDKIRFQMMQNRLYLTNYLLSGDSREAEHVSDGIHTLTDRMQTAAALATSEQQRTSLAKVQQTEQNWGREFADPLIQKRKEVDQGNSTVAELQIFYLQKDAGSWVKSSTEYLDQADQESKRVLEERRKSDEAASNWTIAIALLGTLAALTLGALIAVRTAQSITEPLAGLIKVTKQIGTAGDLDHELDVTRTDEIGELSRTFNGMVSYLKEMASVSQAIAGGNLSVDVKVRSKSDTLGNAFVRMVDGLRNLVRSVRDAASQVASASSQVAGASDDSAKVSLQTASAIDEVTSTMHEMSVNVQNMVKNTQTQASSVSETSASIDQMVASIQRVADTAKVLLDISNRSREEVQSGISTMEKATDGLNKINNTIRSSGEIIDVLGQRADDIGKIIEVIDDLAEQTNLLALNAAIEAARAGEHGLGFAVVADEVRKLAEKSAQSTKEISELIQSIQKEARKAVENMDRSTGIVNDGLGLGQELNAALRKISNVVTEVYKFAQEIGAATNEQSHGSSQIARATTRLNEITHEINSAVEEQASGAQAVVKAMERMRELVQQTTSGSTELAASAEQMSKMSRELLDSMHRFALEHPEHVAARPAAPAGGTRRAAAGAQS